MPTSNIINEELSYSTVSYSEYETGRTIYVRDYFYCLNDARIRRIQRYNTSGRSVIAMRNLCNVNFHSDRTYWIFAFCWAWKQQWYNQLKSNGPVRRSKSQIITPYAYENYRVHILNAAVGFQYIHLTWMVLFHRSVLFWISNDRILQLVSQLTGMLLQLVL